MRKLRVSLLLIGAVITVLATSHTAHAQGTAFTYSGQLSDGNGPVTGSYDLMFTLYGASSGGGSAPATSVVNLTLPIKLSPLVFIANLGATAGWRDYVQGFFIDGLSYYRFEDVKLNK